MIVALKKRRSDGSPYTRFADIEQILSELTPLSDSDLLARLRMPGGADGYVPTQCVVYFARRHLSGRNKRLFESLFRILMERVRRSLPRATSPDGKMVSMAKLEIYENIYDVFVSLLSEERHRYVEQLDFFEINFIGALANLKITELRKAKKKKDRDVALEDEKTGEVTSEVEAASERPNPLDPAVLDDFAYRSRWTAAMDKLPSLQRRIMEMLRVGTPIDSSDPHAVTIAKTLGKSEKTIRNQRDKAYSRLKVLLSGEGR